MINSKSFMDKTNEIEQRINYVLANWKFDSGITTQEVRYTLLAYVYGLYRNKKIEALAKAYLLHEIENRKRLDTESLLTALTAASVIKQNTQNYCEKLINKIKESKNHEKYDLATQFLFVLTPQILRKLKSEYKNYIGTLVKELKNQGIEKKLTSYWIEKRLFSYKEEKEVVSYLQIEKLNEYLLWEITKPVEYAAGEEKLRTKFIPQIRAYEIDRIDLIVFLIYLFLKKYKLHIVTERELNKKIKKGINAAISKKLWLPLVCSMVFVLIKLGLANMMTLETFLQIFILIFGILLLFFEEKLPSLEIPIKRYKITCGQMGELLMFASILWAANLASLLTDLIP